jgi:hypothetical protein
MKVGTLSDFGSLLLLVTNHETETRSALPGTLLDDSLYKPGTTHFAWLILILWFSQIIMTRSVNLVQLPLRGSFWSSGTLCELDSLYFIGSLPGLG